MIPARRVRAAGISTKGLNLRVRFVPGILQASPFGAVAMQLNARPTSIFRLASSLARILGMAVALLALTAAPVSADIYPSRPIRVVVPTQAGAAQDIMA